VSVTAGIWAAGPETSAVTHRGKPTPKTARLMKTGIIANGGIEARLMSQVARDRFT
jgi:hypothetical protein